MRAHTAPREMRLIAGKPESVDGAPWRQRRGIPFREGGMFMKTIATWISENPYIAAAGLIATFLGLIIAIITPIIQRKRKQLHYTISVHG